VKTESVAWTKILRARKVKVRRGAASAEDAPIPSAAKS